MTESDIAIVFFGTANLWTWKAPRKSYGIMICNAVNLLQVYQHAGQVRLIIVDVGGPTRRSVTDMEEAKLFFMFQQFMPTMPAAESSVHAAPSRPEGSGVNPQPEAATASKVTVHGTCEYLYDFP